MAVGKNKKTQEFHYRAIPEDETVLAQLGARSFEKSVNGKESVSKRHFHNLVEIAICRWGNGEIIIDQTKYSYEAGCVLVIPPNISHAIIVKEDTKNFWEFIYLNPSTVLQQHSISERDRKIYFNSINEALILREKEEIPFLISEIDMIMDQIRVKEYGYRQCIKGLVYALLMEIVKITYYKKNEGQNNISDEISKPKRIIKVMDYIEAHYFEQIKIEDIAKAVFVSPTSLRKMIQDHFGMSPLQYINYVRVEKACELIRKTDHNMNEIARKVGYDNMSTFINNFKAHTGESPKQWKEKQGKYM